MFHFSHVQTLAFAGGGNRCWWQAGLLTQLQEYGVRLPARLVGTSAGAAIAASLLAGSTDKALQACKQLYAANAHLFDWRGLARWRLNFAHQTIYPAWLAAFVNEGHFKAIQSAPSQLLVAVTRPAWALGLSGSIAVGTLAYLVDQKLFHHIHPALPRFLGLKQAFFSLHDCATAQVARTTCRPQRRRRLSCLACMCMGRGPSMVATPTTRPFPLKQMAKKRPHWFC